MTYPMVVWALRSEPKTGRYKPALGKIAKALVGWSIGLSVLMILTGVLAIMIPPVAGIAVLVVVAWLLMFSDAAHLVFAWYADGGGNSMGT